ncbi:hypothetical protein GYMLUDRAFT_47464 [Collybiopsis luxurians FD-317 M1]|uniref:Uncharacterized protein n=1 Tax=Collybiopsis luxurians FD-317 M1 TaxID=944289 RepID=A0A0D0CDA6_9AGAR|nr:hypothetical protein GYMLUDRAFT_47464 [Collybiopsis luxurians FD-317 M1]
MRDTVPEGSNWEVAYHHLKAFVKTVPSPIIMRYNQVHALLALHPHGSSESDVLRSEVQAQVKSREEILGG